MKIIKMVKYQLTLYFKGTGFVVPFIIAAIFLYAIYSQKPIDVLSGFLISGVFIFLLMTWVGMVTVQQEEEGIEQILFLKMNSAVSYYIGKLLYVAGIALVFAGLCVVFPLLQNLMNGNHLFERELVASDLIGAILLISSSGICGAFLGSFFHPRVFKNRKFAYALLALISALCIAELGLIQEMPFLKYILWVLPYILYPSKVFAKAEYFDLVEVVKIFCLFLLYGSVYGVAKSIICSKNKF